MGRTDEWAKRYRASVCAWLETSDQLDLVVNGLTVATGLELSERAAMVEWLRHGLVVDIDNAVENLSYYKDELSALLANAGVLPLFGFPTRVRDLYRGVPDTSIDQIKIADRALEVAVGQYAPGSEVLNENQVHVCVGFAAYSVFGRKIKPIEPLSRPVLLNRCPECLVVEVLNENLGGLTSCPSCGASTSPFWLYEPLGFRTDYNPVDFDDRVERRGYIGPPQLSFGHEPDWAVTGQLQVATLAEADVFTVNDNGGALFSLHRFESSYVVADATQFERKVALPKFLEGKPADKEGAIGYVKRTDVLVLRPMDLDLPGPIAALIPARCPAGSAAFWSFGEIMRRTCALDVLGIDPAELQLGIQAIATAEPGATTRQVFLADRLENGAGYAAHLGQVEVLEAALKTASFPNWIGNDRHRMECSQSCPICLQSYDNRFLHPLLDWRLALDMLELVRGEELSVQRWLSRGEALTKNFVEAFSYEGDLVELELDEGLYGIACPRTRRGVLLGHPLWSNEAAWFTAQQAAAARSLRVHATDPRAFDLYFLSRKPHIVYSWLQAEQFSTIGLMPRPEPIGRVSPTVANSLLACPLRVGFSRDRRLSFLALGPKPGAILGTASHALVEAVARGDFDEVSFAQITESLGGRWDRIVQAQEDVLRNSALLGPVPHHHRWPFYEVKRAAAIWHAGAVLSARQEVRGVLQSRPSVLRVETEIELECDDPPLTGRIDLVERTAKGIRIIDLKSGLAEPSTEIQPAHRVQLLLYCALYKGVYGELPYEMEIRYFDGARFVEPVDSREVDDTVAQVLGVRDSC